MVTKYGMSDRLGPITYGADSSNPFLGKEMGHVSNYSEETAAEIDEEIKSIICDAYDKTKKVLSEHIDLLHRLAGVLFEREKLDADEFLDVMNGKLLVSSRQKRQRRKRQSCRLKRRRNRKRTRTRTNKFLTKGNVLICIPFTFVYGQSRAGVILPA